MAKTSWTIEPFDKQRHDRTGFDCGVAALDDWLATKVSQFEKLQADPQHLFLPMSVIRKLKLPAL